MGAVPGIRPNDSYVRVCLGSAVACICNWYDRFIHWSLIIKKEISYGPYKGDDFFDSRKLKKKNYFGHLQRLRSD